MIKTNDLYEKKLEAKDKSSVEGKRTFRPVSGILDTDLVAGMRRSVDNGQQRLALEYIAELIEVMQAQIAALMNV